MLTAEENIVLPLELGGTKLDKDWVESVIERGRPRRPAQAPARGALGRPAAARRHRPRPHHQADGRLRGRADGQPRLDYERGDPRAPAGVGRDARPDVRHGLARPEGDRHRRPRRSSSPTACIVKELGKATAARGRRDDGDGEPAVIRVALRGLLGRKLRATLTALAIILGVAMMSGTYVLTDTIDKAFSTIFDESYAGTDVVVSGKGADISFQGSTPRRRRSTSRSSPRCARSRASRPPRAASPTRPTRRSSARTARRSTRRARPASASASTPARRRALQPAEPRRGHLGRRRRRGRHRRRDCRPRGLQDRRHDPDLDPPAEAGLRGRRASPSSATSTRSARRPSPSSTSRPPRGCSTGRVRSTRSRSPATEGTTPEQLIEDHPADPPRRRTGPLRRGRGAGRQGRDQRVHQLHRVLPARVRRHRPLRRRVRHLQHALDHGRPAHPRVRHDADRRRLAPPDSLVGHRRGARRSGSSPRSSASSPGSGWPSA